MLGTSSSEFALSSLFPVSVSSAFLLLPPIPVCTASCCLLPGAPPWPDSQGMQTRAPDRKELAWLSGFLLVARLHESNLGEATVSDSKTCHFLAPFGAQRSAPKALSLAAVPQGTQSPGGQEWNWPLTSSTSGSRHSQEHSSSPCIPLCMSICNFSFEFEFLPVALFVWVQ